MGVYIMVNVTLECDTCHKALGKLNTSKRDIPAYANARITCQECLDKGVEHPSGSTDKDTLEYVDKAIAEAKL